MKKYISFFASITIMGLTSCSDFLSELPDNRTEINTPDKVTKLLVSAYPKTSYILPAEISSDNVDDQGESNPNGNRLIEQLYNWQDVTEVGNDSPTQLWGDSYKAISSANQALEAIDQMGNPESLNAAKGEALLCRAFNHFVLVNIFAQHYSPTHSSTDLGITYMEKPEKQLNPQYTRNTVAEVYAKIEKDLEEGLPLIDDKSYTVTKYHFNKRAAYTFASRFYLYYLKWDKVIECANVVLGDDPLSILRENARIGQLPTMPMIDEYVKETNQCNFLCIAPLSFLGTYFGPYTAGARITHGLSLSRKETLQCGGPWGNSSYYIRPVENMQQGMGKVTVPRLPVLYESADPIAGTVWYRTVHVVFTAEEALLNRAEAYILKKEYDKSLTDLNLWVSNTFTGKRNVTEQSIENWANNLAYYTPKDPTPKKALNPEFTIEPGKQENFIHSILQAKRIESMHMGLRWFDVKRYGIEVTRRTVDGTTIVVTNKVLKQRDNRRAIQLPADAIFAGIAANPR